MKRLISFILTLLCFMMLVGCEIKEVQSENNIVDSPEVSEEKESEFDEWGLKMDVLLKTSTQFDIIFSHNSQFMIVEGTLTTDPVYEISAIYNDEFISFGDYMRNVLNQEYEDKIYTWNSILYIIGSDTETSHNINLDFTYGKLPVGEYVISKKVVLTTSSGETTSKVYTANFAVVE